MADDEARLLPVGEARVRRRLRDIANKDAPKSFVTFDKDTFGKGQTKAAVRQFERTNPTVPRRFTAYIGTKVRGQVQNAAAAELNYHPAKKHLEIKEVYPLQMDKKTFGLDPYQMLHKEAANKMLPKDTVKGAVTKAAKSFSSAETLSGERVTGLRQTSRRALLDAGREVPKEQMFQKFNLAGIRKRLGRLGKVGKVLGLGAAAFQAYEGLKDQ
jgi:hypothetical protein